MKRVTTASMVAALALVLSACGSGAGGDEDTGSSAGGSGASSSGGFQVNVDDCEDPDAATAKITGTFKYGWSAATSGPLAGAVGAVLDGVQDRFDVENEKGGIDGVKLEMVIKDDAFSPDKAKANGTELIQNEKVDAIAAFGGGQMGAILDDQNAACIPALLAQSSDPTQRVIADYPWTIVALPSAAAETAADVEAIKKKYPDGVKVGIAENQTASGKTISAAFQAAAKGSNIEIVSVAPLTDPNAAVTTLKEAGAQVVFDAGVTTDCLALSSALGRIGFKPELVIHPSNCVDGETLYKPAGAAADGAFVPVWIKDPAAQINKDDPAVVEYLDLMDKAGNKAPLNSYTVNGWIIGDIVVDILKKAAASEDGLSHLGIIKAARNQTYAPPMYIDGINWQSTPEKFIGVSGFQPMIWNATKAVFEPEGEPIDITALID